MKVRAFSLLLLLAMLITAIPVAASAVEANDVATVLPENVSKPADLHNYYVQDGLTALFTTFGEKTGVDLAAGTWTDRIGGKTATLGSSAAWKQGEHGGIGFDVIYGIMVDGKFETTYNSYANDNYLKLRFGIDLLPASDFSVEYLAKYKPVYVAADTNGTIATDSDGDKIETFDMNHTGGLLGGVTGAAGGGWAIDHFGWFSTYTNNIDGRYDGLARGDVFWCFDAPSWYYAPDGTDDAAHKAMNRRHYSFKKNTSFSVNKEIHTYGIYLDETLTVDGEGNRTTTALLSHYRDAVLHADNTASLNSTANSIFQCNGYYDIDTPYRSGMDFSLSTARPTDFFVVRVYDRVLTEAEKHQNHAVDVLLYYGVSLPVSVLENELAMRVVYMTLGEMAILTDTSARAAAKAQVEAQLDAALKNAEIVDLYADPAHMTSFFSIYTENSLDVYAGTWADLLYGGSAKMTDPSRWFQNANGSFGYNVFAGYVDADGNPGTLGVTVTNDKGVLDGMGISTVNHGFYKENYLDIGIKRLPTEDYTVEYMAMYRPILVADAAKSTASEVVYAKDADGNLLEAYNVFGKTPTTTDYGTSKRGVDTIGWYTAYTTRVDSYNDWSTSRGAIHWTFGNFFWGTHNGWWVHTAWGGGGLNINGNPFQTNGSIRTYGITLDETYNGETGVTSAVFGLYRDAVKYKDNSDKPQTTECLSDTTRYEADFSASCQFYLSAARPTDFFGLRVYDKVLTDAERTQNRAADAILYYGLDISAVRGDEETLQSLYGVLAAAELLLDASAKAAEAVRLQNVIDDAKSFSEFADKYAARESMTSLFTTYAPGTVNLTAGTWTDLITHKNAKLATASKWKVGEYGGIGFNTYYGMIDESGNYTVTSDYNYYNKVDLRLQFGVDFLPADDFTIEYMAMYKPIYVTDTEGNIAVDANGKRIETYNAGGNTPGGMLGSVARPVDFIGFFQANTNNVDGSYSGWGRSNLCWFFNCGYWYGGRNDKRMGLYQVNDPFQANDKINVYGIYVDETVTTVKAEDGSATEVTSALFGLYRNCVAYADNGGQNSTANASDSVYAYYPHGTSYSGFEFWMSASRPTDFFTVRIYNRVLTDEERQQNRMVDLLLYYGLELTEEMWADDALMANIFHVFKDAEFVRDHVAKTAQAAKMQATIDQLVAAHEMRELYAKPEDLTRFFTVYVSDFIDLKSGTWTDILSRNTATLNTPTRWFKNPNGSVGFNVFYGMKYADGTVVGDSPYNYSTTKDYNIYLNFGINALPTEDFTMEYVAMYKPVYVADEYGNVATDAKANKLEAYDHIATPSGHTGTTYGGGKPIDYIGWFQSYTNRLDNNSGWGASGRGAVHWLFDNHRWTSGRNGNWIGGGAWGASGGLNVAGDPFQTNDVIRTYGISVDETLTVDGAGARTLTATFALYRNAADYKSTTNSSANGTAYNGYYDTDTSKANSNQEFYLSCCRPTDFFTVRIYDTVLTADEKTQNLFVDMLYYYGIELPENVKNDKALFLALAKENAALGFATDSSAKTASKAAIKASIDNLFKTVTVMLGASELARFEVAEDTFTLPAVVDGKLAVGWQVSGTEENLVPGTVISVTEDVTLVPTFFTVPETRLVPSVKVAETPEDLAVRFVAELYRADYLALCALYGKDNVRIGMLITPDVYVAKAGAFTREALAAMVAKENSTSGAAYIQIAADGFYTVGKNVLTIAGSVNNFRDRTFAKNPAFAAIAFVDVDTDGDGLFDLTVYGNYNKNASASVKSVLTNGREQMTDTQKGWIDTLLSKFGA